MTLSFCLLFCFKHFGISHYLDMHVTQPNGGVETHFSKFSHKLNGIRTYDNFTSCVLVWPICNWPFRMKVSYIKTLNAKLLELVSAFNGDGCDTGLQLELN